MTGVPESSGKASSRFVSVRDDFLQRRIRKRSPMHRPKKRAGRWPILPKRKTRELMNQKGVSVPDRDLAIGLSFLSCRSWEKRGRDLFRKRSHRREERNQEEKRFLIPTSMTFFSGNVHFGSASFAVTTVRRWWFLMGFALYPDAKELTITADGGRK